MIRTRIMATGACVPEQIITNDDLAKVVDTSDEWISQRTGIRERRISAGENTSALAIGTAKQVIERAEISPEDVDLIIVASVTPDYGTPSLACMVQKELGMVNAVVPVVLMWKHPKRVALSQKNLAVKGNFVIY